jgi:ABC-type sugar transport system substrate-binding protein
MPRSTPRARTVAGAFALVLALAGCGASGGSGDDGDTGGGGGGGGGALDGMTVALVGYGSANPWGAVFNEVFADELAGTGVEIEDLTTMDPGTQVQKFNQAVAQRPDLIVVAVLDTQAMVVPIQRAQQADVPVLVVDGRPDPSVADEVMSVLSDNVALGEFAAQNLIEGLRAQGRESGNVIVLTGTASMLVTQDRMEGFRDVMSTAPEFTVIEEEDANWDPQLSGQIAQQLLAKHGCEGVQAAYGMADYMALPIVQAAEQAGCAVGGEDGIVITGGNCFRAGIEAIRAGQLYGTATEDPPTIATQTADYTVRFLSGENPPRSETVEEARVTAENVDQYAEQCSRA